MDSHCRNLLYLDLFLQWYTVLYSCFINLFIFWCSLVPRRYIFLYSCFMKWSADLKSHYHRSIPLSSKAFGIDCEVLEYVPFYSLFCAIVYECLLLLCWLVCRLVICFSIYSGISYTIFLFDSWFSIYYFLRFPGKSLWIFLLYFFGIFFIIYSFPWHFTLAFLTALPAWNINYYVIHTADSHVLFFYLKPSILDWNMQLFSLLSLFRLTW